MIYIFIAQEEIVANRGDETKNNPGIFIYILQNHKINTHKEKEKIIIDYFIDSLDQFQIKYRKKTRKVDWNTWDIGEKLPRIMIFVKKIIKSHLM